MFHIHESEDLISSGKTLQTALQSQSNYYQNYNCLFAEMDRLIAKFIWKFKKLQILKQSIKKNKFEGLKLLDFKNLIQTCSNQNGIVLA